MRETENGEGQTIFRLRTTPSLTHPFSEKRMEKRIQLKKIALD